MKKTNKTSQKRGRKPNIGRNAKYERNNYQDDAMMREKEKGEREAKSRKFPRGEANTAACNDPSWYAKNQFLLESAASLAYGTPLGAPFRMDNIRSQEDLPETQAYVGITASIPGVMSILVAPTPGKSIDYASPVNVAAQNVYSYVRYKNSGAANYDAPDLMLYLLAMDSLYAAWNWAKRLYGLACAYNQLNRYTPRALVQANGVDYDDLVLNLANFRTYVNKLGAQINSFCVPATMNYLVRHSWMFSNVYKDSDTSKSQFYEFVPAFLYMYSETTSEQGGELIPININQGQTTLLKTADVINLLNNMVSALSYSEDIGIMSGDILKAYGQGGLFILSPMEAEYTVQPVYNREVLSQIENLHPLAVTAADVATFKIGQNPDTNYITFNPTVSNATVHKGVMINIHSESPTPSDTMVATRLITLARRSASGNTLYVNSYASEIVTGLNIYVYTPKGVSPFATFSSYDNLQLELTAVPFDNFEWIYEDSSKAPSSNPLIQQIGIVNMVEQFDWHPTMHLMLIDASTTPVTVKSLTPFADIDMFTIASTDVIDRMNEVALLSLFDVPADGPTF